MKNEPLVSVYTCVYNMADKIHRALNSVKRIDYPNIEHIIINDGSTDNVEEMILSYKNEVQYPVKYIKKENGGKHTALNIAWDIADGEFMIQCDADDELLPHSITYLLGQYNLIPEEKREQYWCVLGRCVTQHGDFVGDTYPQDINKLSFEEQNEVASRIGGEKVGLQKRDKFMDYRFPYPIAVKFISEGYLWEQINEKYMTWYTNEVVRVYYVMEGGSLSDKPKTKQAFSSFAFNSKWQYQRHRNLKTLLYYEIAFCLSTKTYKENHPLFKGFDFGTRLLLTMFAPMCYLLGIFYVKKHKLKL